MKVEARSMMGGEVEKGKLGPWGFERSVLGLRRRGPSSSSEAFRLRFWDVSGALDGQNALVRSIPRESHFSFFFLLCGMVANTTTLCPLSPRTLPHPQTLMHDVGIKSNEANCLESFTTAYYEIHPIQLRNWTISDSIGNLELCSDLSTSGN